MKALVAHLLATGWPQYPSRAAPKLRRALAGGRGRRRRHRRGDLVGAGEGEVFDREFGRQDLDHRLVLDPDFDHVEGAAVAAEALPALTARDRFDRLRFGGNAEREMGWPVTTLSSCPLHKPPAVAAARLKLRSRRIDLDTRSVLVELKGEKAPRIGRKRNRDTTHELGQNPSDMLRIARSDG